ncbi:lysophospholipid acyltransferase family protein [Polynucleobacter sp.]|uniref:lysophospholipid acyltransferase family protein n=1 Tax=Polynucleobacter sp. TaxID=2029855 RepID=UPI0033428E57
MLIYIRSLLFYLYLISITSIAAFICILITPITSVAQRYSIVRFWSYLNLQMLEVICKVQYQVLGMEHIQECGSQPMILLSKHQSAWETIVYPYIFPKTLCFVSKRELLWLPFFGWALASLKMITINRGDREVARAAVAVQGRERLAQGQWIAIFPEGTRTPVGSYRPYRKGGFRLALATGTDIIPVAQNAGNVWPRNSFLKYPGMVTVSIGHAISVQNKSEEQIQAEVEAWIEGEMHRIDPTAYQ